VLHKPVQPGVAALVGLLGWGLTNLLIEPFRVESATLGAGLRTWQVAGLAAALAAMWGLRQKTASIDPDRGKESS
jgi:hypothetical protein